MDTLLWLVSALLALVYVATGYTKLTSSRARLLANPGMGWVEEVPTSQVRLVGLLEIAGAIGVLMPWATGIMAPLTPLAALGLAAVQVGAIATHVQRGETEHLATNVLLLAAALMVAVGRVVG
jgi:hypothetical protein